MHSKTLIINSIPATTNDHDHDLDMNSVSPGDTSHDHDTGDNPQFPDEFDHDEINSDTEPVAGGVSDNNPPDSFWVSNNRVTDWLNHHTFIERKTSVKLVASSRNFDSNQTRSSQRSVSFNHKPAQATIIGFRQKPAHSSDGKSRQHDRQDNNIRLFKNRSVPGKGSGPQVNEPRSPRVSCMGRVGSIRGRARRTGFWKNVKTAILNRVRTSKVPKKGR